MTLVYPVLYTNQHLEKTVFVNGQKLTVVDIDEEVTARIEKKPQSCFRKTMQMSGSEMESIKICHQAESLQGCGSANPLMCM